MRHSSLFNKNYIRLLFWHFGFENEVLIEFFFRYSFDIRFGRIYIVVYTRTIQLKIKNSLKIWNTFDADYHK